MHLGRPEDVRFCASRDGTRIAYAVAGSGSPILWAQHWIHHLDLDWPNPIWRPWLEFLTRRHTVVRYDWRGCGLSDRDEVAFSPERYVDDLEAVVEAAGLDRFPIIGMSNGAHVGASYAARRPERVSHLVLCAAQSQGRLSGERTVQQIEEVEARVKMITLAWADEHPAYRDFSASLHIPDASPQEKNAHTDLLRRTTVPGNIKGLIYALAHTNLQNVLPLIECPTLVFHARGDCILSFEEGRRVAAQIPRARFVPLDSRNHVLLVTERAWRRFVGEIEPFLSATTARTSGAESALPSDLTRRELEVLESVARGLDNGSIAAHLGISEKTVRNHITAVFSKLAVATRAGAVARARDAGMGQKRDRRD